MPTSDVEVLWEPSPERIAGTRIAEYQRWLAEHRNVHTDTFDELWQWSVKEPEAFWLSIWDHFEVVSSTTPSTVLPVTSMPGAEWFPDTTVNWAQNILSTPDPGGTALIALDERGQTGQCTWHELESRVAGLAQGLRQMGVEPGDRVAAVLPNIAATVIALLATASIGAVWSCCAPDFGVKGLVDRFAQIEPKVLIGVDGYSFAGKSIDKRGELDALRRELPSVENVIMVRNQDADSALSSDFHDFGDLISVSAEPSYAPVSFSHPLWILYSSGTTGLPKGIVHSHGGILLESLKANALHYDLGPGDRVFIAASTAWVVWNMLVDAMTTGATIITYDGSPTSGRPDRLFEICAQHGVTRFGTGAAYLTLCEKAGVTPSKDLDLSSLRSIMSTGSPLPDSTWRWVYRSVSAQVHLGSDSGGTDVASGFIGANPISPVVTGELQGPYLGVAVESWNDAGQPVINELGELVITAPMPSMPIYFWNDPDNRRYRDSYFDIYPGVWRHGDWVTRTDRGTYLVHGRSDSTLNRGGVRMGSADLYQAIETLPEIAESLVVGAELADGGYHMPLFVVLRDGYELTDELVDRIKKTIKSDVSPRHVPDDIVDVPAIPTTRTGKRLEIPVKRLIQGASANEAINPAVVANPDALDWYVDYAEKFHHK